MAKGSDNSVYPQYMQMKKNQFRHSVNKMLMGGKGSPKKMQGDTPDQTDMQKAQQRTIRKMGTNAYKSDLDALTSAYSSYDQGDGGTFGAGGGKGGGGFGSQGGK